MSLVNYGSSDDASDNEDESVESTDNVRRGSRQETATASASDTVSVNNASLQPTPKARPKRSCETGDIDASLGQATGSNRKLSLLAFLPPPKSSKLMDRKDLDSNRTEAIESSAGISSSIKRSFLNLPPPKKKSNQTVKITLPSLPDPGSDEDEPVAKKPTPIKSISSLLSMLPKPKCSMSSRILVPHTVARKQQVPVVHKPKLKQQSSEPLRTMTNSTSGVIPGDYDSDDEQEEGTSFFSLAEPSTLPKVSSSNTNSSDAGPLRTNSADVPNADLNSFGHNEVNTFVGDSRTNINATPQISSSLPSCNFAGSSDVETTNNALPSIAHSSELVRPLSSEAVTYTELDSTSSVQAECSPNVEDAPLSFNVSHSSNTSKYGQVSSTYGNHGYSNDYYQEGYGTHDYNQPYQYPTGEEQTFPDSTAVEGAQETSQQNIDDQEQFRRFLGGKKGSKEGLNIIAINSDDLTAGSGSREALLKNLSEEKQPISYSKKKNADLPSSQQRKKHQITYLAFQAKERELALKNQWSQNRMTRKQTQAKYGF